MIKWKRTQAVNPDFTLASMEAGPGLVTLEESLLTTFAIKGVNCQGIVDFLDNEVKTLDGDFGAKDFAFRIRPNW